MQFPTGGTVRDRLRVCTAADPVKLRDQQLQSGWKKMSAARPRVCYALLCCVVHLGEAKASRVFSSNEKECIFMSEPNANAIPTPSRQRNQRQELITSLAMLTAIAYVVMLPQQAAAPGVRLSAAGPEGHGHLHRRLRLRASWPPPSSPSWWPWWRCSPSATPAPSAAS